MLFTHLHLQVVAHSPWLPLPLQGSACSWSLAWGHALYPFPPHPQDSTQRPLSPGELKVRSVLTQSLLHMFLFNIFCLLSPSNSPLALTHLFLKLISLFFSTPYLSKKCLSSWLIGLVHSAIRICKGRSGTYKWFKYNSLFKTYKSSQKSSFVWIGF